MRMLIQRVSEAQVSVDNSICGKIGAGLLVLLGVHKEDTGDEIPWMVDKLLNLRIFSDDAGKMNRSILDTRGEVLVVSQFTLYGNCKNGRRPEFTSSAHGDLARQIYDSFVEKVQSQLGKVETGEFGALMQVQLTNDGPVTLIVDSKHTEHNVPVHQR